MKFDVRATLVCGFIDGINEILTERIEVEDLEEDIEVDLQFTFEDLYKKMLAYDAVHLYTLPQWDDLFDTDQKQRLLDEYKLEKRSGTVVKDPKTGRNDPCPCGSGLKYKKCCGKVA